VGAAGGSSSGWELDEAYGFVSNGVLYLMLTGNMLLQPDPRDPSTWSSPIHVFIDSQAGGQNTLRSDNRGFLTDLSGLTFDTNFTPDHWLGCYGTGGPDFGTPYSLSTQFGELPSNAGATTTYLGSAQVGGQFPLSGGSNPFGIMVALDDSNTGGVSRGCGAGSGAGITTGFECAIPLAAIGNPGGPIKVCALYEGAAFFQAGVSNQVLGPLPPGTCAPGAPSSVNFGTITGDQFFVVNPATDAVPPLAPLGLWLAPRLNPAEAVTVRVTLPKIAAARLEVIDIGGRRVLERPLENEAAGTEAIELARSGQLPAGVYIVRLTQGTNTVTARVVIRR